MSNLPEEITEAASLDELLDVLRELEDNRELDDIDITFLPTFGGSEPVDTYGIWSWDADRLLVGACIDDMEIVGREEWADRKSA
jgi:hypothetical protein